ncbi:MAG: DNA polymerase ligase N-terminal domain-containing protein [Nanoarchaeota archaeon]|nr:DNA polymerase ligase N-terminal domain-containing protein [Nanoarchaeota archaeon]
MKKEALLEYKQKRNFRRTIEPKPKIKISKGKLKYSIQEHHAKNLHFDLRLEHEGVLKSWAIPKIPDAVNDGKTKRLAIETEDHPYSYWNFKGFIPEGNYGAGTVKIWDKGTYIPEKFSDKEIIIDISGRKLKGKYVLIKTNFGGKNSWLFFKGKD